MLRGRLHAVAVQLKERHLWFDRVGRQRVIPR